MKEREFGRIRFNRWGVSPINPLKRERLRDIYAFDTETFLGKAVLIGVAGEDYKDHVIPENMLDVLRFLTKTRFCGSHNFFFNLKYDRDAIIKHLPNRNINILKAYSQTVLRFGDLGFRIRLTGNKSMTISRGRFEKKGFKSVRSAFFSDISAFYHEGSLENTVKRVLNIEYRKSLDIGEGVSRENITREIVDYCLDDCFYTYLLSKNLTDLALKFVPVKRFHSTASISKSFMRKTLKNPYLFHPTQIQQFALRSYNGGRFEILQKGSFERLYTVDINSAYPDVIKDLVVPKGLIKINLEYEPDSIYSYFNADVEISGDFVLSPFKHLLKDKNGLLVFPTGKFRDVYLSKCEFEVLKDLDCRIHIKKAIHLFNDNPRPWVEGVSEMYSKRKELKQAGDRDEYILKIILNSLYGIVIQEDKTVSVSSSWTLSEEMNPENRIENVGGKLKIVKTGWKAGQWFNPLIASEITSRTRCKLFEDFHEHEDNIVMIATDSVTMDKPVPVKDSGVLGGYKHYKPASGLVLANGIYQFDNGETGKRGLLSDSDIDLFELCRGCAKDKITLTKTRPKSLREGLPFKSANPNSLINIFLPYERDISVNMDSKRVWIDDFKEFREALTDTVYSTPLNF